MAISPAMITSLSSLLTSLGTATPGALQVLGNHLTQSNEMQAINVLDAMAANPATAASLLPELTAIPSLPATVTNWVTQAIANPAQFSNNIAQAKNSLLQVATSSGTLGGLFG